MIRFLLLSNSSLILLGGGQAHGLNSYRTVDLNFLQRIAGLTSVVVQRSSLELPEVAFCQCLVIMKHFM